MIPWVRWRRWLLLSAPLLALSAAAPRGVSPPLMALWTVLGGALLPRQKGARKKRPMIHRLFFAWGAGCLTLLAAERLAPSASGALALVLKSVGCGCFSAVVWERALLLPLSAKAAWRIGGALLALCLALMLL